MNLEKLKSIELFNILMPLKITKIFLECICG